MSTADDMHARHAAILAELQADGLEMARALKAEFYAAVAEKDREGAARLSVAWHRITRSLRQTLALEALLKRQRERDAREAEDREDLAEAVAAGKVKPHQRVGDRLVWHEGEPLELLHPVLARFAEVEAFENLPRDPVQRLRVLERYAERAAARHHRGPPRALRGPRARLQLTPGPARSAPDLDTKTTKSTKTTKQRQIGRAERRGGASSCPSCPSCSWWS